MKSTSKTHKTDAQINSHGVDHDSRKRTDYDGQLTGGGLGKPHYQWSGADGTIFRGRSVASGRDQARAERRFFRQHRHVQPEGAER
jgi:hypothetical protein